MSTSAEVNKKGVEFMLKFVAAMLAKWPWWRFHSKYTSRPCFAKLEKEADTYYKNTISLISELRVAARATGSIEVAVNEPFPSLADSSESSGCKWVLKLLHQSVKDAYMLNSPHAKASLSFWHVELRVIITLTMLWLIMSHAGQLRHWVERVVVLLPDPSSLWGVRSGHETIVNIEYWVLITHRYATASYIRI